MDESNNVVAPTKDELQISDLIEITVKTIDSKNFQFQVENDIQIRAFKEKVASQVGIESENQRMIFCGRVLSDDKTLKDYNIDNGKVIHLVKRAPPPQRNNNTTTNNANQQQNDRNSSSNRRFQSYRSEDGSLFMGTISMDSPSNLINQMVRQIFTGTRNGSSNSVDSNISNAPSDAPDTNNRSSLRNRINHIRRFLGFINTNFQILENPNLFPTQNVDPGQANEEQVFAPEYITLFNEATSYSERLRPHLTNFFQSISSQPSESELRTIQNNYSILMRISHHLSHVLHLLTEFNIDFTTANMPLVLNTLDNPANNRSSSSSGNANIPPGVTARIEISTSAPTSMSALSGMNLPSNFSQAHLTGNSFFNPSPIVLMEVDTNINVSRNFMQGLRGMPNIESLLNNQNLQTNQSNQSNPNSNNSSSNTSTCNTTTTNTSNTTNTTNTTSTTTSTSTSTSTSNSNTSTTTNANQNNGTSTSSTSINLNNGSPTLPIVFDPFLNCNSTYTIPEVRSATNLGGMPLIRRVMDSLEQEDGSSQEGNNQNNPLLSSLNDLFRNVDNSSPQSSDEFEFFDLIRFLLNQINLNNEDLPEEINDAPRIGDYLRNLNLVNATENQSIISDFFSQVIFQNLGFEDLLHLINREFHEFNRFRQPFQDFVRTQLLHNREWTIDNIRSEISTFITANHDSLITIIANIAPNHGVDSIQSFQNFIKEALANFFNMIMQSGSDESFENDLLSALKYLVSSYIHFCRACFSDPESMVQLITNYFEQYASYLNPRIQQFITGIVIDRVRSYSSTLEDDQSITSQVQELIVHTEAGRSEMQVETSEPDRQSISNDSEIEFSDAISDFPSTSSTTQKLPAESEEQNWQSIVPTDWVPIISEDINKQKNIDSTHQPPFSDAYLNGMPKKRRLEHKPEDDENPEPKLRPKSQ